MDDELYMRQALALACLAEGDTSPNPMVGAVIVSADGEVVGEGYHHKAGQPHAEINALKEAKKLARGGTIYVTLEPCSHFGRTGPCCEAIIAAGLKRVVAAVEDPNPKVAGNGFKRLRDAGIEVTVGVCAEEARLLNEKFFHWIVTGRPFVSMKYAMTLDGKIATRTGDSKWITGEDARAYGHYLRKAHDCILVGKNTVLADDPELTTRLVEGRNPLRIVLDSNCEIPMTAKIFDGEAETLLVTGTCLPGAKQSKAEALQELPKVEVLQLPAVNGKLPVALLLQELAGRNLTSILVEGGSTVHGDFLEAGLVDRIYAFIAPKLIGGKEALTPVGGKGFALMEDCYVLKETETLPLGADILLTGRVERNKC
ncbi:bifunctional diaminohydroxyphosphoribosylaminopyrimidine deaminase/5-amino-6-(5-phosphoribosylamino)uracil reductase RibD [Phascolarctobacterium faecium]|uniref:bifunctional diaminohydroxyphosphoribosylaminopyrimidine deaminase/5-amino-6-(5-phosphoribosylamino)uracil reductase RibD n=1 Tax=Phascolarctobacterium faecium TaxID=33025 RepID=UPI0035220E55